MHIGRDVVSVNLSAMKPAMAGDVPKWPRSFPGVWQRGRVELPLLVRPQPVNVSIIGFPRLASARFFPMDTPRPSPSYQPAGSGARERGAPASIF